MIVQPPTTFDRWFFVILYERLKIMVNNENKRAIDFKVILAVIFCILGYIGSIWIFIRATVIEWMFIRESFWNMINPLTHVKVFWYLLHDLDIYAVALCWIIAIFLAEKK